MSDYNKKIWTILKTVKQHQRMIHHYQRGTEFKDLQTDLRKFEIDILNISRKDEFEEGPINFIIALKNIHLAYMDLVLKNYDFHRLKYGSELDRINKESNFI